MKDGQLIEKFKMTRDYRDICYMLSHVEDINARISVLEDLGYRIGISINIEPTHVKNIMIGKKKDIRMQITPQFKKTNISNCVIVEQSELLKMKTIKTNEDQGHIFTLIGLCEVYREKYKKEFDEAKSLKIICGDISKEINKDDYIEEMKKIFSDKNLLSSIDEVSIHSVSNNNTDNFLAKITITH